jgi:hypothetical protein
MALIADDRCLVVREGHPLLAPDGGRPGGRRGCCPAQVAARRSVSAAGRRRTAAAACRRRGRHTGAADRAAAGQRPDGADERPRLDSPSNRGIAALLLADARFRRQIGGDAARRAAALAERFIGSCASAY